MTCKDCLFFRICCTLSGEYNLNFMFKTSTKNCVDFRNKNNFIELPFSKNYISDVTKSVYVISENKIVECFIKDIEIKKHLNELIYVYYCIDSDISCLPFHYTCELGKNMFLTREEAENALYKLWRSNQMIT